MYIHCFSMNARKFLYVALCLLSCMLQSSDILQMCGNSTGTAALERYWHSGVARRPLVSVSYIPVYTDASSISWRGHVCQAILQGDGRGWNCVTSTCLSRRPSGNHCSIFSQCYGTKTWWFCPTAEWQWRTTGWSSISCSSLSD